MPFLWALWGSKPFRWAAAGFLVIVGYQLWLSQHDLKVSRRAEAKVYERSADEGKKANAEADKAHVKADRPGAAERVLKSSCRDCAK